LGSFSEAQTLVEPELLERVFEKLVSQCARRPQKGLEGRELLTIDSTLWRGGQADELGVLEEKKRASRGGLTTQ
jgi:hypothetical protein